MNDVDQRLLEAKRQRVLDTAKDWFRAHADVYALELAVAALIKAENDIAAKSS